MTKSAWNIHRRARALAITICAIWDSWSDIHEDARDDALRLAFEAIRVLDLTQPLTGELAGPLRYFTAAYLDEINPEDLTYDQMVQDIAESLALDSLSPRSADDATGN